jgi:tRNA/rRNA methyltransferase
MDYKINVVLVRPMYPSNIGSVSRAISNMGADRLILIDRKCDLDYSTQQAAASGQEAWQTRTEYTSWDEFYKYEGLGLRIALTARDGRGRAVRDLKETLQKINEFHSSLYLFFGPEDAGLAAEDLTHCHFCTSIPIYGLNSSLNLAQAVLLALFIVRETWGGVPMKLQGEDRHRDQKIESLIKEQNLMPEVTLKTWLETLGFDLSKEKTNAFTVLQRMMLHNIPTPQELRMFEAVVQQTIRKLQKK